MTTHTERLRLAQFMDILVQRNARVHYRQARPMVTRRIATGHELARAIASPHGLTMDCSESVTLLCRLAGMRDPSSPTGKAHVFGGHNWHDFDGAGFTGTLLASLPHYMNPAAANVGALVVFGGGYGEHVCMVRHPGRDPILFSHGSEAGPFYIRLSVERRYHDPPVRFLAISRL